MTSAIRRGVASSAVAIGMVFAASTSQAVTFTALQSFGDSYSDTGAFVPLTDGGTAVSYLAEYFGNPFVLPDDPAPGTSSINFAQSAARVGKEQTSFPAAPLRRQVDNYVDLVNSGVASFDPASTLFFLSGGLNDHNEPADNVTSAYREQVADLVGIGARYIQIAKLPSAIPGFMDSASNLNPAYAALVPDLDAMYPDVSITLSNWGTYYDDIINNPDLYGFTNVTDPCLVSREGQDPLICDTPETYFYYIIRHPSDAAHQIVGARLYDDTLELNAVTPVPVPATIALLAGALGGLGLLRRRRA